MSISSAIAGPARADGAKRGNAHNDWVEWAIEGGTPLALLLAALPP